MSDAAVVSASASALGRLHVLVATLDHAIAALAGGAPVIQVRVKEATDRHRLAVAVEVTARCRAVGATCIVDDRADIALAADADGVHLGADDLPVEAVRALTPRPFVIGGTARDVTTAVELERAGADYLGVGPIWPSTTKTGLPAPLGPAGLARVTEGVRIPVIAISGVTAPRVVEARDAGAHGVAVIGAVTASADPVGATRELVAQLRRTEA